MERNAQYSKYLNKRQKTVQKVKQSKLELARVARMISAFN